jgi:concanavalin A-like lectin/glucanase superfamily protein
MALLYRTLRSSLKPILGLNDISAPSAQNLQAGYLLNEAGGAVLHDVRGVTPAQLSGTYNWLQGPSGPVVNFNGGLATGPSAALDPFTIGFWLKLSTVAPSNQDPICKCDSSIGHGWIIQVESSGGGNIRFDAAFTGANNFQLQMAVPDTTHWHFYVFYWDKTGAHTGGNSNDAHSGIYLDGKPAFINTAISGSGSRVSDSGQPLTFGAFTGGISPLSNGQIGSVFFWNRIVSEAEIQDLYTKTYPAIRPLHVYPAPPPIPSQDYIFYDSFDYHLKQQLAQKSFNRNVETEGFWGEVVPTGVPTFGYAFDDRTDYRQAPLRAAHFPRDQVAFLDFAPVTPVVPSQDYIFYDSFDYRAAASRIQQAHFDRNAVLSNFQATVPPSFGWNFYDSFDYKARQNRLAHFPRDYVADAGIIFAATGAAAAPSIGYLFYDSFDYNKAKRLNLQFPRNYVDNTAALFTPVGLSVPSQDYIFYDSNDYVGHARQAAQHAFRRDYVAEPPWSALITPAFVDPAGWYPIVTPISVPVRQRQSYFYIGVPNDLRDGTLLPAWNFLQIGDSSQEPLRQRELFRRLQQNVDPVKPPKTFLSVFFSATWAPWNANLSKAATRNFVARMQAWAASLSILSPHPPAIVGFMLNVCSESRLLAAIKYTIATVCQDPRTVTVPLNTTPVCMTFVKDPQATTDYSIDWTMPLTAASDTIKTSSWATDPGVAVAKSTYVGYVVTAFISGGTVGSSYSVTNTITTPGGRTLAQNFIVKVQLR